MASSKSKVRRACSFTNLLLSCLNFSLFILSASSFAPTILLKMPPTSFGMALLMVSGISLLSSFVGFYSPLTHFCYLTHISLLLASLIGQVLTILALFTKEKASMSLLKSPRDPKEAKLLVRLECGALMAMFMLQCVVLMLGCAVHSFWVKDYEELEAEKAASARKRSRRIAEVQEESMANASKMAEIKAKELDEKMKSKIIVIMPSISSTIQAPQFHSSFFRPYPKCLAMTIDTDFLNTKKKQVSFQLSSLITPPVSTVRFCDLNFGRLQPSDEELGPHKRFEFGNFVAREALLEEEYWSAACLRAEEWANRTDKLYGTIDRTASSRYGYIANLCVAKSLYRKGVASKMLYFAVESAKSTGNVRVTFTTNV
ncbi:hypothetical protein JHK82_046619 [Glycine max]|nr:hypothetical protein JHK86_046516 [Glycine max]KAG5096765.1 hypothetical protein JHK82_046619 [Glycine max]